MASLRSAPEPAVAAYRFGDCEADLRRCQLRKFGIRIKLERKPWQLLAVLLEHNGRLVTRAELRSALWSEGTFVDFELGLNSAVWKLRAALCDSVEEPRYILTFPGEGYRFVAPVEVVYSDPLASFQPTIVALPAANGIRTTVRRSLPVAAAVSFFLLAIASAALLSSNLRSHVSFTAADWALVTEFENRTGNAALDDVLRAALERELNNSHFVHVVARERIADVLALMRRPATTRVDESIGREICLRDGAIKVLLSGRVEKIGASYLLSVSVIDPQSGAALHSSSAEAASDGQIVRALHRLGNDLRSSLGEQAAQIRSTNQQFEKVTTPSLAALKAFTIGYEMQIQSRSADEGATFFEKAVEIDPSFATAWLHLGFARNNKLPFVGRPNPEDARKRLVSTGALEPFERAVKLADSVSERERLFILGSWYQTNLDYARAIDSYTLLTHLYPDHYWATNNLAYLLIRQDRLAEGVHLLVQNLRIRPDLRRAGEYWYNYHDDPQASAELLSYIRDVTARTHDPIGEFWIAYADATDGWIHGDGRAIHDALDRAAGAAGRSNPPKPLVALAFALQSTGRLRAAEEVLGGQVPVPAVVAFLHGGLPAVAAYAHKNPDPPPGSLTRFLYILALDGTDRQRIIHMEEARISGGALARWRRVIAGEIAFQRHDYITARHDLEAALNDTPVTDGSFLDQMYIFVSDTLASCYERTGASHAAIQVLLQGQEKSVSRTSFEFFGGMADAHLADLYRQTGDAARAEAIEKRLASILAYADPDYSIAAQRGLAHPSGTTQARLGR